MTLKPWTLLGGVALMGAVFWRQMSAAPQTSSPASSRTSVAAPRSDASTWVSNSATSGPPNTATSPRKHVIIGAPIFDPYKPTPMPVLVPVQSPVGGNPLKYFSQAKFGGKLVYSFNNYKKPSFHRYLSLVQSSPGRDDKASLREIQRLQNRISDLSFNPQFSPDGRFVLVKIGEPRLSLGSYHMFVWDTETDQLSPVTSKKINFWNVSWSPDGKYIAFITGGDSQGDPRSLGSTYSTEPLRLWVCEWRTQKETLIVKNESVNFSVAWAAPHTLLYSVVPPTETAKGAAKASVSRPATYQVSLPSVKASILLSDSQRVFVSPDGKQLAFFGSEDVRHPFPLNENWSKRPGGASLCVAKRDGSERKALTMVNSYPFVLWKLDNQHLVTVEQTESKEVSKAEVWEWDTVTRRRRRVALLSAKNFGSYEHKLIEPQFRPLQLSPNGRFLFVVVRDYVGMNGKPPWAELDTYDSLQAVDIKTGAISSIARFHICDGLDITMN